VNAFGFEPLQMSQSDGVIPRRLLVHSAQTYAAASSAVKPRPNMAKSTEAKEQLNGCVYANTDLLCIQEVAYEHID
jgi:hypothetical protein